MDNTQGPTVYRRAFLVMPLIYGVSGVIRCKSGKAEHQSHETFRQHGTAP